MDVTAKVVIYEAFVEENLEAPTHLARTVPVADLCAGIPELGRFRAEMTSLPT